MRAINITKFVNVTRSAYIDASKCVLILPADNSFARKLLKQAKEENKLFIPPFRGGRKSILVMDNGYVIVSKFKPSTLAKWINEESSDLIDMSLKVKQKLKNKIRNKKYLLKKKGEVQNKKQNEKNTKRNNV